jgi:hypothetical protein
MRNLIIHLYIGIARNRSNGLTTSAPEICRTQGISKADAIWSANYVDSFCISIVTAAHFYFYEIFTPLLLGSWSLGIFSVHVSFFARFSVFAWAIFICRTAALIVTENSFIFPFGVFIGAPVLCFDLLDPKWCTGLFLVFDGLQSILDEEDWCHCRPEAWIIPYFKWPSIPVCKSGMK